MWNYEKRLQYPVNITKPCPKTASLIISQFGGPDGELAASLRYLSHRHRRIGPYGNHLRHGLPADEKPYAGAGKDRRI